MPSATQCSGGLLCAPRSQSPRQTHPSSATPSTGKLLCPLRWSCSVYSVNTDVPKPSLLGFDTVGHFPGEQPCSCLNRFIKALLSHNSLPVREVGGASYSPLSPSSKAIPSSPQRCSFKGAVFGAGFPLSLGRSPRSETMFRYWRCLHFEGGHRLRPSCLSLM